MAFEQHSLNGAPQADLQVNPLQAEANQIRMSTNSGGSNSESLLEKIVDHIPTPVIAAAGIATGLLVPRAGAIGMAAKTVALGMTAGYLADAGLRGSHSTYMGNHGYLKDEVGLGTLLGAALASHRIGLSDMSFLRATPRATNEISKGLETLQIGKASEALSEGELARVIGHTSAIESTAQTTGARMIQDSEILKFDPTKQTEITQQIKHLTDLGYHPNHLMLGKDGTVMIDREAIENDAFSSK